MADPVILGALAALIGGIALTRKDAAAAPSGANLKTVTVPSGALATIDSGNSLGVVVVNRIDPTLSPSATTAPELAPPTPVPTVETVGSVPAGPDPVPAPPIVTAIPPTESVGGAVLAPVALPTTESVGGAALAPVALPTTESAAGVPCNGCGGGAVATLSPTVDPYGDGPLRPTSEMYLGALADGSATMTMTDSSRRLRSIGPVVGAIW